MLSSEQINVLGQILDSTWTKSSTTGKSTISIKAKLSGEHMTLAYTCYATFASDAAMRQQMDKLIDEGKKATDQYLKSVKTSYKEETDKSFSVKIVSENPSVEIVSLQPHISPRRTVAFRYITLFKIS